MICAISGQVAKEPVLSPKSGSIFDRGLVVNLLSTTGKDPINDEPLSPEELIPIRTSDAAIVPPKPPAYTSIPSMLSAFQNEWDSVALEVFTLRKQLQKAREELSTALYHYDAAVKVASKALKERDEAKAALEQLSVAIGNGAVEAGSNGAEESAATAAAAEVPVDAINESQAALFSSHKSLKLALPLTAESTVSVKTDATVSTPLKKVSTVYADVEAKKVLLGSSSGPVVQYELDSAEVTKISHKGAVSGLTLVSKNSELVPLVVSKTKVALGGSVYKHSHKSEIRSAIVHPGLHHLFVLQSSKAWSLNDASAGTLLHVDVDQTLTTAALHVDGVLLAVAGEGVVLIYNITTGQVASEFKTKHSTISKMVFALNGYWLLVASYDDQYALEVVDLRKSSVIHTIEADSLLDFDIDPTSSVVVAVSGTQLAVHRYVKKGKTWVENAAVEDLAAKSVSITSSANDPGFQETRTVAGVATTEDGTVQHFHLEYA